MAPAAILDLEIRVFGSMNLLDMVIFVKFDCSVFAIEKLLRFLFSVGNVLEQSTKNWVFLGWDFRGEN